MKRDLRQWINLIEASRASRISRSDVMNRLRQLSYEDKITRKDILYAYHNIMRSAAFEGGRMVVYRGMNVEEPEWFTDLAPDTNLGRYWAYNRIGANAGSWDTPNVIFTALVKPADIDWGITIAQEIAIGGEYEITLGGVQVILKSIEFVGDAPPVDFSSLYGKSFWT